MRKEIKTYLINFFSSKFGLKEKFFLSNIDYLLNEIYPTERAFRNLKRILENDYYLQIYFESIDHLLKYLEIIIKISAFSNYLTDVMVRNPEFLTRFLSDGELDKNFSLKTFSDELEHQVSIYKSPEKKINAIKRFKRLHLLRIGLRDILSLCGLEQTMLEYSFLTHSILNKTFQLALEINRTKFPIKKIPPYALVSLGKLGGLELNFSSDVDLICFYDNPDDKISTEIIEFYDRVIKDFIQICGDTKDGSPLYRIDFRLRPDGKYSPLARSISYYKLYYESYGRDWERQMLLKMNFISGDKNLFAQLSQSLQNFIYPRSLINSPKNFIRKFRNIYLDKLSELDSTDQLNLKHFSGGIRDLEFSVQALQLLHGGNFKDLRTTNTIEAIENLAKHKLIKKKERERLIDAYKFLRRIENFVQLMDDRQIHTLPQDRDKFENLLKYLGITSKSEFNLRLKSIRKIITDFSNKVFERDDSKKIKNLIYRVKTGDKENLERTYFKLKQTIRQKSESHTISLVEAEIQKFERRLINSLMKSQNPEKFLSNLLKFTSNLYSPFQIVELIRNKNFSRIISEIFENSEPLSQSLIHENKFVDYIFSGLIFHKYDLDSQIKNFDEDKVKQFIFYLMFNFFTGNLKSNEINELLSTLVDKFLLNLIIESNKKYNLKENEIVIIGLGSYGNREMHFKSDVDVLFIFSDETNERTSENFAIDVLSTFRNKFKLFDVFQIDSKLRPEGTVSKLSWSINEIEKYIYNRMRIWEFQAYTKMRLVYGNEILFNKIIEYISSKIRHLQKDFIVSEIKKNRINIKSSKITLDNSTIDLKNSSGGLMDLQFFFQYKTLLNNFDQKLIGKPFKNAIKNLLKLERFYESSLKKLVINYQTLIEGILTQQILTGKKSFLVNKGYDSKYLHKKLRIDPSTSIFDFFNTILKENYHILQHLSPEIF